MITRIVRMVFEEDKTNDFLLIFNAAKAKIKDFDGCEDLELHQDYHNKSVYYTKSIWQSQSHLEAYRQSELFKTTWAKTKVLFADKPMAFSLKKM
ncbi:MAG: antibiotic biosynthesis monooxygenase family protein [Cyclobacteriaceae bacterium]